MSIRSSRASHRGRITRAGERGPFCATCQHLRLYAGIDPVAIRLFIRLLLERRSNSARSCLQAVTPLGPGRSREAFTHGIFPNRASRTVTPAASGVSAPWSVTDSAEVDPGAGSPPTYRRLLVHPTHPGGMTEIPPPSSPAHPRERIINVYPHSLTPREQHYQRLPSSSHPTGAALSTFTLTSHTR